MTPAAKPRTLIVGNFLSATPGATRGVCEELALRLRERGFAVLCASTQHNRLVRLADMMATAWNQRNNYDLALVDVYSGPAFVWAEAVCAVLRQARRPYILTLHGGNLPNFASRWPARVRRLLAGARAVTAPSSYLQKALRTLLPAIELIPNAIDVSRYAYRQREVLQPRLVWMRAFHQVYNPLLAIHTIAEIARTHPAARLDMAGPDKGDGTLEAARELTKTLGMTNHVSFHGRLSKADVPSWLAQGDIFLNTANVDNTPVTVLEAMACGLCTVSTDVGGMKDLVRDGSDALLIPPGDAASGSAAIRRLLTDPHLAGTLSRSARQHVERLDWQPVLDSWEDLMRRVAAGGPTASMPAKYCVEV